MLRKGVAERRGRAESHRLHRIYRKIRLLLSAGVPVLALIGHGLIVIPSATSRGLSEYLWRVEQVSHALANGYYVGTINRVGIEPLGDDDFYGQSYFVDPRGQFVGDVGDAHEEELIVRDLDLDKIEEVRQTWQFFRDRRPELYGDLVKL